MRRVAVSILAVANAGDVSDWLDQFCQISDGLAGQNIADDPAGTQKLFGEYIALFADTIDCSEDPGNNKIGYNKQGVAISECMAARAQGTANVKNWAIGSMTCTNKVADEDNGKGVVFVNMKNAGTLDPTEHIEYAGAMSVDIEGGLATTYSIVYDTQQLLAQPTAVADWIHRFCDVSGEIAAKNLENNPTGMQQFFQDYAALFTPKIDCSEDPNNGQLGYDLHQVSMMQCYQEKMAKMEGNSIHIQFAAMDCIDSYVDEAANKGVVWMDYKSTGKFNEFRVRGAIRFELEGNLAKNYHVLYDSWNYLNQGKPINNVILAQSQPSAMMLVGALGLIAAAFVAGMKLSRKKDSLLQNEVLA